MRQAIIDLQASRIRDVANAGLGRSDVLAFWFGESDEVSPDFVRQAAIDSLNTGETFYAHNLGLPSLREAIATEMQSRHAANIGVERVAVTSGGVNALMLAMQAIVNPGDEVVVVCAKIESELTSLEDAEREEFLESLGLETSGLDRLIQAGFRLLGLITYLTAGVKEVRAWTIRQGTKAPQAAGVIHTDFEKKFIKAEVIWWEDYVALKGEAGARAAGKLALEGKEYVVRDGDVMHFKVGG